MPENYYNDQTLSRFIDEIMLIDGVTYEISYDVVRVALNKGFLIREREPRELCGICDLGTPMTCSCPED